MTTRRRFLSAALVGLSRKSGRLVTGGFVNDSFPIGHRLRDHTAFRKPRRTEKIPVVIVGGGIAGLSAAWWLDKHGFQDFVLLEMAGQPGGNSRWGENEISPYPWAAHYVPVPNRRSTLVRELFTELGLIHDGDFEERHLCFTPQERLFLHGRWQEGIEPQVGATGKDLEQLRAFENRIEEFRASGEFTIPIDQGARPSPLDRQSMTGWLAANRFDSPYLHWYINYACRDDYGAPASATSAWAGIHYFAARDQEEKGPFTWPEGNGWIVKKFLAKLSRYIRANSPVYRIARDRRKLRIATEETEYCAESLIFAAPTFLAPYLIEDTPPIRHFDYSPWLTANLTLDRLPRESTVELAWDNVIFDSPTLGYVVATHQNLATHTARTVWTHYWALAEHTPAEARHLLLEKDWAYWKDAILNDLAKAHPDIHECVAHIDIMRHGHAMIRPTPGFLMSGERRRWTAGEQNIHYANSDLSGISIFEEAQYRGVLAAASVLRRLGASANFRLSTFAS